MEAIPGTQKQQEDLQEVSAERSSARRIRREAESVRTRSVP